MAIHSGDEWTRELKSATTDMRKFFLTIAVVMVLALVLVTCVSDSAAGEVGGVIASLQRLAGAIVLLIATASVGGILGFLFGIPRSITQVVPNQSGGVPHQAVNTNLEQISDWLTKVIVGVGLVEFRAIGEGIIAVSQKVSPIFGSSPALASMNLALSTVILVGSAALGFLFSYVETRTLLSWLFANSAKREHALNADFAVNLINQKASDEDGASLHKDSASKAAMTTVLDRPFEELITNTEKRAWANAQFMKGNRKEGADAFRKLIKSAPNDYTARRDFGRWMILSDKWAQGKVELETALRMAEDAGVEDLSRYKLDIPWAYLYHPTEFERALELCQKIIDEFPELASDPRLNTYIASAAGQAAAKVVNDETERKRYRKQALEAIKKVRNSPRGDRWMALIKGMINASSEEKDNDLKVFQGDEEFTNIIGK